MGQSHSTTSSFGNYKIDMPLLTAEEERSLARTMAEGREADAKLRDGSVLSSSSRARLRRKVRAGDAAREKFITSNLRLVVAFARRTKAPEGVELDDIIQAGNLGLMHAVERFDPERGFKFSTYAVAWIKQSIQRSSRRWYNIKIPQADAVAIVTARRAGTDLEPRLRHAADMLMVASLDWETGESGKQPLSDSVADEKATSDFDEVERQVVAELVKEAVDEVFRTHPQLDAIDRFVYDKRFSLSQPLTFKEISEEIGDPISKCQNRLRKVLRAMSHHETLTELAAA